MDKFRILHGTYLFPLFFLLLLSSCSSKEKQPNLQPLPDIVKRPIQAPSSPEPETAIDMIGLQNELGLSRQAENLGFAERGFNTCEAGYGYSGSNQCYHQYYTVIHFQLLCRDSQGTISTALRASDMKPLSHRPVRWTLKGTAGTLQTDVDGFGQIRTVTSKSQQKQRLKLGIGNDFLYTRAGEITQIVTPQTWCDP